MPDHLTPEQRHRCMQANRSAGTRPEIILAHELWHRGLRYRRNVRSLPGTPDICFKKHKLAIFVDGEFWHGRNWQHEKLRIKSRRDYWWPKIERNILHDQQVNRRLQSIGYTVLRFWETQVRQHPDQCADQVQEHIRQCQLQHLHRVYQFDTQYEILDQAAEDELFGK